MGHFKEDSVKLGADNPPLISDKGKKKKRLDYQAFFRSNCIVI